MKQSESAICMGKTLTKFVKIKPFCRFSKCLKFLGISNRVLIYDNIVLTTIREILSQRSILGTVSPWNSANFKIYKRVLTLYDFFLACSA